MKEDMREVGVTEEDAVNSEIETADLLRWPLKGETKRRLLDKII